MNGYFLARACWIVRRIDDSAGRLTLFADVAQKNVVIRLAYVTYECCPDFVKSLLLLLYGLKCYLSVNSSVAEKAEIAYFASYPNEIIALGQVRRHLSARPAGTITLARRNCFRIGSLLSLPAYFATVVQLRRIASRLAGRFHFMPACRIFSTTTYYLRFRRVLQRHDAKAVFIANHYSPECLALAAAAHRLGWKVLFTNHANATWEGGYVPPLYSDLAAVTSQAVLDVYLRHSRKNINAVFVPLPSPQRAMRKLDGPGQPITVGIFLTALTNMERLHAVVGQLEAIPEVSRVLIRPHPVKVINENFSALCRANDRTTVVRGITLFDTLAQCDVAICGNSTATVEILRGGVPVLYDGALDAIPYDYNGYIRASLIPPIPDVLDSAGLRAVHQFYGNPAWAATMRYFDAAYQQDEAAMYQRLDDAVRHFLQ